jgi:hypothetical protein
MPRKHTESATLLVFEARGDEQHVSSLKIEFASDGSLDRSFVERMLHDLATQARVMHGFRFNFRAPVSWETKQVDSESVTQQLQAETRSGRAYTHDSRQHTDLTRLKPQKER